MEENIDEKKRSINITSGTPILFAEKIECCGCEACYAICPKKAIIMQSDEEGFRYPVVKENVCIKCYQCIKVCPIKKTFF